MGPIYRPFFFTKTTFTHAKLRFIVKAACKGQYRATLYSPLWYTQLAGGGAVALVNPMADAPVTVKDEGFGEATPFILLARCHVKPENKDKWMEAAKVADAGVRESEPGMLHHTWDVDPEDPLMYVWSEVYANDAALLAHLSNPPLQKFVGEHTEWGDGFSIEIYGTLAAATKEAFSATGFSIKYYDTALGYSRVGPESSKCSL